MSFAGERVLDDESLSLVEVGLRDGSSLGIERGKRLKSGTTRLRVSLVAGNDTSVKFNPHRPGTRGDAVEIEVARSTSITELRDLAGVVLAGLPAGWTKIAASSVAATAKLQSPETAAAKTPQSAVPQKKSTSAAAPPAAAAPVSFASMAKKSLAKAATPPEKPVDDKPPPEEITTSSATTVTVTESRVIPRRLRRTNGFEECGEVIEEMAQRTQGGGGAKKATSATSKQEAPAANGSAAVDATTSNVPEGGDVDLVPVTVDDVGLQNNDLVLLEEGSLPKRGMMRFKVSWNIQKF
jgi:hypothetical protein